MLYGIIKSKSDIFCSDPITCMNPKNKPENSINDKLVLANIFLNDNLNTNSSKIGDISTVNIKVYIGTFFNSSTIIC